MATIIPPVVSDEFILTAFERCPSGLMVVNSSGQIITVNREVERQFGYTREELLGQSVEMLVPESLAPGHSKLREQYAAVPIARPMGAGRELFGRHKDGREIPVEIGLSSIATPEGLFVLATIVDVSERRRLEDDCINSTSWRLSAAWRAASLTTSTTSWRASSATPSLRGMVLRGWLR